MENRIYYTYYSYEEWGRGYIGSKPSGWEGNPEEDPYMGSFYDKTFKPTQKIILGTYSTPKECIDAEIKLHNFYEVHKNPHFANRAKQTSSKFIPSKGIKKPSLCGNNNPMKKYKGLLSGEKNGMYGKNHSIETIEKIRESRVNNNPSRRAIPIILIHPNGNEEKFNSSIEACKKYNLSKSKICSVIRGHRKHHKGYKAKVLINNS